MLAIPARVIATLFMLACFAATIVVGIVNGNGWASIMLSASSVAAIAWVVGMVFGVVLLKSVNEHIERHRLSNPIPDEDSPSGQADESKANTPGGVGRPAVGR